jgi:small GTP-binding protein
MADPGETLIKLLIIGESAVGKSCLLLRFAENKFSEIFVSTIGIDFKVRHVEIDGAKVKLQIWDTAGQEKFRMITKAYYRGAHGILLVYDVTSTESFNQTGRWMRSIQENVTDPVVVAFVGNKCDMDRVVQTAEGEALAKEFGVEYYETSAKTGKNVEHTFMSVARAIMNSQKDRVQKRTMTSVTLAKSSRKTGDKKGCCS